MSNYSRLTDEKLSVTRERAEADKSYNAALVVLLWSLENELVENWRQGDSTALTQLAEKSVTSVVKCVAKEVLDEVLAAVEQVRLDSEVQDADGNWIIDEQEFVSEFTFGRLSQLYSKYGLEIVPRKLSGSHVNFKNLE